jgi:mRNA-degrading endonuclease RelE of RelBE toxin-antitoxin system
MSYEIIRHKDFDISFKRLAKRHRSLIDDYEDFLDGLEKNPFQGAELSPGIRNDQ